MNAINEFGLKIKNIEASTLFEYNNGVRDHFEYKDALFANSLFKDYIEKNGLKVWKSESTRDIICLEFNYGSRSYQQELDHLHKIAMNARAEYRIAKSSGDKYLLEKAANKKKKISDLINAAYKNRNNYRALSTDSLRDLYYEEGVDVPYVVRNKAKEIIKVETIHYRMLFRSTGKAKKGSCMFIREELHKKAERWMRMGIKLPMEKAKIVEISAYAPLTASGIVDKIRIIPENILILKDVDRFFITNIVSVELDENKNCVAKRIDNYKLKNTLFDGEAIIDESKFPEYASGYILLRHHFTKMAAFCGKIQKFFRDQLGDAYETATVTDMFGTVHYLKDIEMITTDNAVKWIKFDISYEYWCKWVHKNDCEFGIVKTAHPSKLGNYQKMSYQMVNSLDVNIMQNVVKESVDYINRLKTDIDFFIDYLKQKSNFSNDFEVLAALSERIPDFTRSSYFRERRKKIIFAHTLNLKSGEVMQEADNLTIVGSPYALLLYALTGNPDDVDKDDTFCCEKGTIQCYTERFEDGEYLAGFRSPFNGKYNLTYMHNVYDERFKKYFNFGRQIIAVNMIGTDTQDRNNGADQDSDFMYVTHQRDIVEHARKCYLNYPTIVNNIPKDNNVYQNTPKSFSLIDNKLAASQTDIGGSSNLAQIAQTYECTFSDKKYSDYVCILSVLAQVAIDNAKRTFDVDVSDEIRRIKDDMNIRENKYPKFWSIIKKNFNRANINPDLICPMNYLYDLDLTKYKDSNSTLSMDYFFVPHKLETTRRTSKKVEELIEKYSLKLFNYNTDESNNNENYLLVRSDFDALIHDIQQVYVSKDYAGLFSYLLDEAFSITNAAKKRRSKEQSIIAKNRSLLIKVLYTINPEILVACLSKKA